MLAKNILYCYLYYCFVLKLKLFSSKLTNPSDILATTLITPTYNWLGQGVWGRIWMTESVDDQGVWRRMKMTRSVDDQGE